MTVQLTREQARRIVVRAQLLDDPLAGDVVEVADQLGYIKIDPTSVIAPAEHTMLFSRVGRVYEPGHLTKATEDDRMLAEFGGTFRPMDMIPLMLAEARRWLAKRNRNDWIEANGVFRDGVLARLRADGPLLAKAIPDTAVEALPDVDGWYSSNQVPRMLEALQLRGEVAVSAREGRQRVWDLAERVYPQNLPTYDEAQAQRLLAERRLRAAGIAKQSSPWSQVEKAGLEASVEGSKWTWRVDPGALERLDETFRPRCVFLSPYDSMLFDRPRLKELFEFEYVLEQFKPKPQRKFGYFAHPILLGDRFIGQLDAEVDWKRMLLRVNAIHEVVPFTDDERDLVDAEIAELAAWLEVDLPGAER
ncbi:MAG: crosslink repair DNA glycosylase YcaQ family protein [Microbacterium sp.]